MNNNESIKTRDGTSASPDSATLPVPLEPPSQRQPNLLATDSRDCLSLRFDKCYNIRDVSGDKVLLKGVQDFHPFSFDGLKNVLVRDNEDLPVARVRFKEKSWFYSSMALAVYAPCDVLVGTGEETSGLFMFTSKLLLRNSDGDELFNITYNNKLLSSNFIITAAGSDKNGEVAAKILQKSKGKVRLQIVSKMNLASKIVLVGFCLGLLNKCSPPYKPDEMKSTK